MLFFGQAVVRYMRNASDEMAVIREIAAEIKTRQLQTSVVSTELAQDVVEFLKKGGDNSEDSQFTVGFLTLRSFSFYHQSF